MQFKTSEIKEGSFLQLRHLVIEHSAGSKKQDSQGKNQKGFLDVKALRLRP